MVENNDMCMRVGALIKQSLWNIGACKVDEAIFNEMKLQAIVALSAPILNRLEMKNELLEKWKMEVIYNVTYFYKCKAMEDSIPITVPYAVLKGSSAAQYYPHPEYRTMGDIDIITSLDNYNLACDMLLKNGFQEIVGSEDIHYTRHREFKKNGIEIEIHKSFSKMNDLEAEKRLDDLIIRNINASHKLPDLINGLVLIQHINQHLENGLGFRQIIDWMMYVNECLPDEKWVSFQPLVKDIGLEKLAIVITRMCEIYLGLPERTWCSKVDVELCSRLMDYIFNSGNFGNKKVESSNIIPRIFAFSNNLKGAFRALQNKGLLHMKLAKKNPLVRPFAWLYQLLLYSRKVLFRKKSLTNIRKEYVAGKDKTELFEELGIMQTAKRNVFNMGNTLNL